MAAEVIHLLIPSSGTDLEASRNAVADQRLLAKYLLVSALLRARSNRLGLIADLLVTA